MIIKNSECNINPAFQKLAAFNMGLTLKLRNIICLALLCSITYQWGQAIIIFSKANLAQALISTAWSAQIKDSNNGVENFKPWPWADTWPVAKLKWQQQGRKLELYVLAGAQGASLAFGPGHLDGTSLPGQGSSIIAGHRDTHFSFLRDIKIGQELQIQTALGQWRSYIISETTILDTNKNKLTIDTQEHTLFLVTCYPFDSIVPGGPLRYVVTATLAPQALKPITLESKPRQPTTQAFARSIHANYTANILTEERELTRISSNYPTISF